MVRIASVALGLAAAVVMALPAAAVSVNFARISSNAAVDASAQLKLDVADGAGVHSNGALFSFSVVGGVNSGATITGIYFDDRPPGKDDTDPDARLFEPPPVVLTDLSSGVKFTAGSAAPPELPSGPDASPPFVTTAGLLADSDSRPMGVINNGISVGNVLVLKLVYDELLNRTFDDLLSALRDGSFRVGLQVQSLNDGKSDQFVSTPIPIPLPMGAWLALTAVGGLVVLRRRRAAEA